MAKTKKTGRPVDPLKNVRTDDSGRVVAIYKSSVAQIDANRKYDSKLHHITVRLPAEYKDLIADHINANNEIYPDEQYTSVNNFIRTLIDRDFLRIKRQQEVDNDGK